MYSRDGDGNTVVRTFSTSWSSASTITLLGSGYEFTVIQWSDLEGLRIFYQDFEGAVRELISSNGGSSWGTGGLVVN